MVHTRRLARSLLGGELVGEVLRQALAEGLDRLDAVVLDLGAVGELKNRVGRLDGLTERSKGALKALTYVAICAWTFLLSQRAHHALLSVGRRVLGG